MEPAGRTFAQNVFDVAPQDLTHTPRLRVASTGCVRRIAVEDFGDLPDTRFVEVRSEGIDKVCCPISRFLGVPVCANVACHEGSNQPSPDGSLMVGAITTVLVSAVMTGV